MPVRDKNAIVARKFAAMNRILRRQGDFAPALGICRSLYKLLFGHAIFWGSHRKDISNAVIPPAMSKIPLPMFKLRSPNRPLFVALLILIAVLSAACGSGEKLPDKNSAECRDAVRAFYVGLA